MANKHWKAKRLKRIIDKRKRRIEAGKPVYFTITHSGKPKKGFNNKYCFKSNLHKVCYKNQNFYNVRFHACIITNCNFRGARFIGTDFIGCNLKNTNFKDAKFTRCVFFNCKINDAVFNDCSFSDVVFVNTPVTKACGLTNGETKFVRRGYLTNTDLKDGCKVYAYYPKINLILNEKLLDLSCIATNPNMYNLQEIWYKVLFVNKSKINFFCVKILEDWLEKTYNKDLIMKLPDILKEKVMHKNSFFTVNSLFELLTKKYD